MSESETDIEFVSDMEWLHSHDREAALPPEKLIRLFALARCGADAADEIERLKAELLERDAVWLPAKDSEIERLRAALRPFADALQGNWSYQPDHMKITAGPHALDLRLELLLGHFRAARAALKEDGDA